MAFEAHARQLRVGHGDAGGVRPAIEFGTDAQAGAAMRRPDEADDGRDVHERRAPPIHRDVREEAVLDLVPLCLLYTSDAADE